MKRSYEIENAKLYGVNCAIFLDKLRRDLFIDSNTRKLIDSRMWVKKSVAQLKEELPEFSTKQINNVLKKMIGYGLIEAKALDDDDWDRTNWFAITKKGAENFQE